MPIDAYSPCPCGTGKKIKFCCSADIVEDLGKILRMMEGDQRKAALDAVDKLLAKRPNRPSKAVRPVKPVKPVQPKETPPADVGTLMIAAPGMAPGRIDTAVSLLDDPMELK